jgi:class 3 adenylate cyclase
MRLIQFDKRGTGLSDRDGIGSLEDRMDDFRAVMDDAGIARASLAAVSEGGPLALLFAATYPERVERLMLYGTFARALAADDYPAGPDRAFAEAFVGQSVEQWGRSAAAFLEIWGPSAAGDPSYCAWFEEYQRQCCSPGAWRDVMAVNLEIDVRAAVPAVRCPTVVIHRRGDRVVPVEHARWLVAHLPNARYVELNGDDHVPWLGDADAWIDAVEEWLTGKIQHRAVQRRLATVLFTDIVDSTRHAERLGDARWRALLGRHDAATHAVVTRFGGKSVKSTGDGVLATFDSPAQAMRAALTLGPELRPLDLSIRAGLHAGEIEERADDVAGIAVHLANRIAADAAGGEVLVSSTVRDLVAGSRFRFEDRGSRTFKGVDGEWRALAVTGEGR